MEEKKILLKTIEALNATISSLSSTNQQQAEQLRSLQERVKELTAQVAWLNRQLFGRKSENLLRLTRTNLTCSVERFLKMPLKSRKRMTLPWKLSRKRQRPGSVSGKTVR